LTGGSGLFQILYLSTKSATLKKYSFTAAWVVMFILFISCHTARTSRNSGFTKIELTNKEKLIAGRIFPSFVMLNDNSGSYNSNNNQQKANKTLIATISSEHRTIAASIKERYETALGNCKDGECLARAFSVTPEEMKIFSQPPNNFNGDNDEFRQGLQDGVNAMNYIFDIYLAGKKPRYPKIDGASLASNDAGFLKQVKYAVEDLKRRNGTNDVFYGLPWLTALKLLELNGRDEAARYEPLAGINSAAYKNLQATQWDKYEFSAILVPGLGPQTLNVSLDPGGAKRCELAASRFRRGDAPFIIVSGGNVHPDKTPYNEAIEMKNYLVSKLKIPANAVIAEPYARHTTTNIRNASRMIFTLNMPSKKPVLIVTDIFQTTYIPMMKNRFIEELGYLPYQEISKSKAGGISFIPDILALKINPLDPLDP
jgi:hypothetical protein